MRVFASLNCILCNKPFTRLANQPRSPHDLQCGLAMCRECFEKEAPLKKEERNHQCGDDNCFSNASCAYFLIDILSQETALTLSPMDDGYLLVEPIVVPECSVCHEAYSNEIKEKKSFVLRCNHIICTKCYQKLRQPNNSQTTKKLHKYWIMCPSCNAFNVTNSDERKDRFHDFLDELPRMNQQLEAMKNATKCDDCHKKYILDEMFQCIKCTFEICSTCAFMKHRNHDVHSNLAKKADEMFEELQLIIKTYKGLFPNLHMSVLHDFDAFATKLLSEEETLKEASNFVDLQDKKYLLTKLKTDFEAAAEEYLADLRSFGTEVKELLQILDENVAVLKNKES